jgi:hypothetical protein
MKKLITIIVAVMLAAGSLNAYTMIMPNTGGGTIYESDSGQIRTYTQGPDGSIILW